ncbi:ABC transporter ATP-binding protein [Streptomyces purpurascens]|uniref:ABC transporter ATP-binding protein n=1 Tax=Streptomyces purpurascens TaxID=1924 RepID=UPI001671D6FF|nr:ABC transporter ATP-binding protein [Streptomyces purpurascens]MCE7050175.1 ABC transporter ATP-binding protein/permease [Streptomyces purpurascens]GHA25821.1 multidrug ABC transporter permease [Streptomyces purpurascens]
MTSPVPYPAFSLRDLGWTRLGGLYEERRELLGMLRFGSRRLLAAIVLTTLVEIATAPLTALCAQRFVHVLTEETGDYLWPAAGFAAAMLLRQAAEIAGLAFRQSMAKTIDGAARSRMRRIALRPAGISHLEDPEFQDVASRAADQGIAWRERSVGMAAVGQVQTGGRMLSAIAMGVALAVYFPLLACTLIVLCFVIRSITLRQWLFLENVKDAATPERRKVDFWADLAAGPEAGTELRLFGLAGWVSERRLAAHYAWLADYWRIRRNVLHRQKLSMAITAVCAALALGVPGTAALDGEIDVGTLAFCLVAAWGVFVIANMGNESYDIEYGKTAHHALRQLEGLRPPVTGTRTPAATVSTIRFEDVTFTYPGAPRPVLSRLNLTIRPGERLAIVGVNGAGKTTLIKLLAGLYTPTAGRITVDGEDLCTLDPAEWRSRMTALFQDFVRYPLTLRENITLAAPEADASDAELEELLRLGALEPVLASLESGLDTVLWNSGSGGRGLSGGQWQRLAAVRTLYARSHGRRLVVLDEPTAHLDVKAEARFYDEVVGAVRNASVVLISHRLSTVRSADRIVLLDNGRITEDGSHTDLLKRGGDYGRLFRLQASRFSDGAAEPDATEREGSESNTAEPEEMRG